MAMLMWFDSYKDFLLWLHRDKSYSQVEIAEMMYYGSYHQVNRQINQSYNPGTERMNENVKRVEAVLKQSFAIGEAKEAEDQIHIERVEEFLDETLNLMNIREMVARYHEADYITVNLKDNAGLILEESTELCYSHESSLQANPNDPERLKKLIQVSCSKSFAVVEKNDHVAAQATCFTLKQNAFDHF